MNSTPDYLNFLLVSLACVVIMALIATGNAPDF
jgi:hypothetical protein